MVTMRMRWCVRFRDEGVLYPTPLKVYFSLWLFYFISGYLACHVCLSWTLVLEVSCIVHWYPVRLIWQHAFLDQRKPSMHIFVGNLDFSATEQDIRQLFERYGVVDTVRIMTDRRPGAHGAWLYRNVR